MFDLFFPKVPHITAEDVKKTIDAKEDMVLLDVRTPQEFTKGHIAGSINIPVDEIVHTVESKLPNKQKKIYVYCLSGNRSVRAVSAMIKLGYTAVFDMKSGLLAWRAQHYPVNP